MNSFVAGIAPKISKASADPTKSNETIGTRTEEMIMSNKLKACQDCQGEMIEIVLMDRAEYGQVLPLQYRLAGDKPKFWGGYPSTGNVESWMCGDCGRIALYGAPSEKGSASPPPESF
jgi:hypothetical protein